MRQNLHTYAAPDPYAADLVKLREADRRAAARVPPALPVQRRTLNDVRVEDEAFERRFIEARLKAPGAPPEVIHAALEATSPTPGLQFGTDTRTVAQIVEDNKRELKRIREQRLGTGDGK